MQNLELNDSVVINEDCTGEDYHTLIVKNNYFEIVQKKTSICKLSIQFFVIEKRLPCLL